MFRVILDWILRSSADPHKLSLTLKGGIPFVLILFAWFGYGAEEVKPLLNEGIEQVVNAVALIAMIFSGVQGVYGFIRKVVNTFRRK